MQKKNNVNHNNLKFQEKFDEITYGCCVKNFLALFCEPIKLKKINVLCENALDAPMNIVKKM